jgi:hypothetical protein
VGAALEAWRDKLNGMIRASASFSRKGEVTCDSLGVSGKVLSTASTLDSRNCIRRARAESSASSASLLADGGPGRLQDSVSTPLTELGEECELLDEDLWEELGWRARLCTKLVAAANASSSRDIANSFGGAIDVEALGMLRSWMHPEPSMCDRVRRVQKQRRQNGGSARALWSSRS